jgi:Polyketide cyclase / dehydrase and lipid transport
MSIPITETVLDYQPGELQLLHMEGMSSGRARWELTPEDDGTRLTTTFDYALAAGVFGKIADALIAKRMNGRSDGLIIADSAGALACSCSRRPRPVPSPVVLERGAELAFDAWWAREPLLGVDARSPHGRGWGAHQMRGGLGGSQSCVRRVSQQRVDLDACRQW